MVDPRTIALRKFSAAPEWTGFDLLARCATDPPLAIATLLDTVRPERAGDYRICELGFGSGSLLDEMARAFPRAYFFGLDQAASYVHSAHEMLSNKAQVVRGDMEALPFADKSFDVIVTCWTLYFMRDIDAALEGMKRSLRAGGRLVAATVAPDHMLEYEELVAAAVRGGLGREREPDIGLRFDLESGEPYMRRHFARVELRE